MIDIEEPDTPRRPDAKEPRQQAAHGTIGTNADREIMSGCMAPWRPHSAGANQGRTHIGGQAGRPQTPGRGVPGWQEALKHVFNLAPPAHLFCSTIKAFDHTTDFYFQSSALRQIRNKG